MLVTAGKHRRIHLSLNGIALLANVDPVSAHGSQELQLPDKIRLHFLVGLCNQEGGEPPAGDPHPPQVQLGLQLRRVGGVLVADLASGEARQGHFADGLLESVLRPQLRHVVVAPADGRDAQGNMIGIKHKIHPP